MTTSTPTIGTKVGRARRSLGQLWQVPTFLVGLLAFMGVAVSAPWRHPPDWYDFQKLLTSIRDGLDPAQNPDPNGDALVNDAETALLRVERFADRLGETEFLAGSAYYRQAQQKPPPFDKEIWPKASMHLEKALQATVPEKDRSCLQYRLGYCWYQQGKEVPRAIELMTQAVDRGAEQPLQGYQLLVQANLQLTPPNLESALYASRRILDLTPEGNAESLALARIAHSELLIRKNLRAEAIKELEPIPSTRASPAVRIKARLLQARCCEETGEWEQATKIWQELLKNPAQHAEVGGRARIAYEIGWCAHRVEPQKLPETVKAWSEALQLGGPAGLAAGLYLGQLRLSPAREVNDPRQALADWKRAMQHISSRAAHSPWENPYIKKEVIKEMFETAIKQFQETRDPQKTQEVAELLRRLEPGGTADRIVAEAAEELARLWKRKREDEKSKDITQEMVTAQFRRAGEAWEQATRTGSSQERAGAIWRSGQCYLAAGEKSQTLDQLTQYVKVSTGEETHLAEAWYTLGDIYWDQGKKQAAHDAFVKCLADHPKSPFAYRSKFFLAVEKLEKTDLAQARLILQEMVDNAPADVERAWQEKALYKLGSVLMQLGEHGSAVPYWKECIKLFPENSNMILARQQLGECYHSLARKAREQEEVLEKRLRTASLPEERKLMLGEMRHLAQTRQKWLDEAIGTFHGLKEEIRLRLVDNKTLTKNEQVLQRRALFGIGECLLAREEYPEALSAFMDLHLKHRQTVEGCYACLRLCNFVEKLQAATGQTPMKYRDWAKESLRLLADDLQTMKDDHEVFRGPKAHPRSAWLQWTVEMQRTLNNPPKLERPGGTFLP